MVNWLNLKIRTKLPLDLGKLHFIGIGGIGMSGIAELIYNLDSETKPHIKAAKTVISRDYILGHSIPVIGKYIKC